MGPLNSSLYIILISSILRTLVSAATSKSTCPPSSVSVRVPPYFDSLFNSGIASGMPHGSFSPPYLAPPPSFYAGTWYQTNSSSALYRNLTNLQWDARPVLPSCAQNCTLLCPPGTLDGQMTDLTTWALDPATAKSNPLYSGASGGGSRPVASFFGHTTPRRANNATYGPEWDGVYDLQVIGGATTGYNESWSVLYWGMDANSVPWMMIHESNPSVLNVVTKCDHGPESASLTAVMKALKDLGNERLTKHVANLGPVEWDYELKGGAPICGQACQENKAGPQ